MGSIPPAAAVPPMAGKPPMPEEDGAPAPKTNGWLLDGILDPVAPSINMPPEGAALGAENGPGAESDDDGCWAESPNPPKGAGGAAAVIPDEDDSGADAPLPKLGVTPDVPPKSGAVVVLVSGPLTPVKDDVADGPALGANGLALVVAEKAGAVLLPNIGADEAAEVETGAEAGAPKIIALAGAAVCEPG